MRPEEDFLTKDVLLTCPRCRSRVVIHDLKRARYGCSTCGLIRVADHAGDRWCSTHCQWERALSNAESGRRIRVHLDVRCVACGMPDSLTLRRERKSIGRRLDLPCRCGDFFEVVSKRWMDVAGPELDNSRDPVFGLEYWLMTPVAGHLLWAANADHIDYLQEAVRERAARPASGLVTVLPGWMLQRNRRVHVLAGLRRLRAQAEATARGPGMSGDS